MDKKIYIFFIKQLSKRKLFFYFKYISMVLVGLFLTGCATIIAGTTQKVPIASRPEGATVIVDGAAHYETPAKIKLARNQDHILIFSKDGYNEETVKIFHVVGGAVCGNLISFGILGWGVDMLTGSQYRLAPEGVDIELKEKTHLERN